MGERERERGGTSASIFVRSFLLLLPKEKKTTKLKRTFCLLIFPISIIFLFFVFFFFFPKKFQFFIFFLSSSSSSSLSLSIIRKGRERWLRQAARVVTPRSTTRSRYSSSVIAASGRAAFSFVLRRTSSRTCPQQ